MSVHPINTSDMSALHVIASLAEHNEEAQAETLFETLSSGAAMSVAEALVGGDLPADASLRRLTVKLQESARPGPV
jgi:hypothetical protein